MQVTRWRALIVVAALTVLSAACGGGDSAAQTTSDLSGSIQIDGSSTVEPLSLAIAEEYRTQAPNVTVNVGRAGTGGGFERFCAGETDINDASRPIEEDEIAACEAGGVEYIELQVGVDALTVVTHPDTNWTDCLTFDQMVRIFGPDGATTWNQVDPAFPAQPLTIFAPDTDSGTYDFFVETVLEPNGIEASRQDYTASADDNQIVTGIRGTPGSWGFFGFAFYQENQDGLKDFEVDGGSGCVAPSVETAQNQSYPLTRPLFLYVKQEALARPEVADFVGFYLDTVNTVISDVGYIPVTDETLAEERAEFEAAVAS
jgi:phosphate transport system substrate-binding protein